MVSYRDDRHKHASYLQLAMMAIARRRQLLDDNVLLALAESSWELLDISGSDVSDFGLTKATEMCSNLRAVDIRYEKELQFS